VLPTAGEAGKRKSFTAKNLTQELVSRVASGASSKGGGYGANRLTLLKGTTGPAVAAKPVGVGVGVVKAGLVGTTSSQQAAPLLKVVKGEGRGCTCQATNPTATHVTLCITPCGL
jgi:hypothetical protein